MAAGFSVLDSLNKNSKAGLDESPKARFRTKDVSIFKMYRNEENFYEIKDIEKLAAEILMVGLMENLSIVYAPCDKGEYKIIGGERRWEALKLLNSKGYNEFEIATCQIRTQVEKHEENIEIIISNSQREKSIKDILEEEKRLKESLEYIRDNNLTIKGYDVSKGRLRDIIAEMLNISKTKVAQIENINNNLIPDFKEELNQERITFSAAAEIAGLEVEKQNEVFNQYQDTGNITHKEVKAIKEELQDESEEESQEEESEEEFNPTPESIVSKCYSCINYSKCIEKSPTVTECNNYINKNQPQQTNEVPNQMQINDYPEYLSDGHKKNEDRIKIPQNNIDKGENKAAKEVVHELKIASIFFTVVLNKTKRFELRKFDRDYRVGDKLKLLEYSDGSYTGRTIITEITCILSDYIGLTENYCILGLGEIYEN